MVVNMENQSTKTDSLLWALAVVLLACGIGAQYLFASQSLLIRSVGLILAVGASVAMIYSTQFGRKIRNIWQESIAELRKVVWPTKQETIHSTLAVLAMVFVMALVLWSIDAVLVRAVTWVIRQGAV